MPYDIDKLKQRESIYRKTVDDLESNFGPQLDQHWSIEFNDVLNRGPGYQQKLDRVITAVDRILDRKNIHLSYKGFQGSVEYENETLLIVVVNTTDTLITQCDNAKNVETTFYDLIEDYITTCGILGKEPIISK